MPEERGELASIAARLKAIQETIKRYAEVAIRHQQADASETHRQAETHASIISRLPIEIGEYYKSEQAERAVKDRREKLRLRLEIWGVVAASVLALFNLAALIVFYRQLRTMQTQTRQSIESFRTEERAWIGFGFVGGNVAFTLGKPFFIPTRLINTGKTPAKDVHGNIVVGVFKQGEKLDFSYTPGHAHYFVQAGTVFPNGSFTESFEGIRHGSKKAEAIIVSPALREELLSGRSRLIVYGRVDYSDIFGAGHWTTYCRYVLHPERISDRCINYNDTDGNPN